MSDEREAEAGAPVEETEVSVSDVQAAVDRASDGAGTAGETPLIADQGETDLSPGVGATEPNAPVTDAPTTVVEPANYPSSSTTALPTDTAVYTESARPTIAYNETLPSAGPADVEPATVVAPTYAPVTESPARDGEIRISADHPMAGLYMQSPMPPEVRGNRGAGVLIALLATVGFAIVLAGVFAVILAPNTPPSQFVDTLIETLMSWSTIYAVVAFFIGLAILVLIVGRAGWWAYVLGGFLVAVLTWVGAMAGVVVGDSGFGGLTRLSLGDMFDLAFLPVAIVAFVVAREATVWFGAWIGARGRRISRSNADAIAEYESALAGAQAKLQ